MCQFGRWDAFGTALLLDLHATTEKLAGMPGICTNAKVSVLDVLHMPPPGNGVWNRGQHHVEWMEVEQVPWWLHGCPLCHLHRHLRAH